MNEWSGSRRGGGHGVLSRRQALMLGAGLLGAAAAPPSNPARGGTLRFVFKNESSSMVATNNTSNTAWTVGPKIFDALLSYARDMTPRPQLATAWQISPDGLRYTFYLRENVRWHDGKPFTADDVAFSILQVLKVVHPRGRGTFANVAMVETPDPHTAIIVLSKPAPYLIRALAATESPIVPKHLFEGTDLSAPTPPRCWSVPGRSASRNGSPAAISSLTATRTTGTQASPISTASSCASSPTRQRGRPGSRRANLISAAPRRSPSPTSPYSRRCRTSS